MKHIQILQKIRSFHDNSISTEKCVDLFFEILRTKGPILEAVTVLKFEKPGLYASLRVRLQHYQVFEMLFSLSVEYSDAKQSLEAYGGN